MTKQKAGSYCSIETELMETRNIANAIQRLRNLQSCGDQHWRRAVAHAISMTADGDTTGGTRAVQLRASLGLQ